MPRTPDSGDRRFRREWVLRGLGDSFLIVRASDLRPGEAPEPAEVPVGNLGEWLCSALDRRTLEDLCCTGCETGRTAVSLDELRARLRGAFTSGTLVAVRSGRPVSADAASRAQRLQPGMPEAEEDGRSASGRPPGAGRGWELSARGRVAIAVKQAERRYGEPVEDPLFPVSQLDRWIANPAERAALVEMYQSVYGPGDTAFHMPSVLKQKLAEAFRNQVLVMLLAPGGGGASGGGAEPVESRRARQEEEKESKSQQPSAPKKPEKTWVRFKLLDEDGEPMDGEPYRMVDSNGSLRTGKLDKDGCVYIPPILTPGNCTITFPEIHLNPLKNPNRKRTRKST